MMEFPEVRERRLYDELRARLIARVGLGIAGELEGRTVFDDLTAVSALLERLDTSFDVHTMSKAYHFIVGQKGEVFGLTAGDQYYEDTGLIVDTIGWLPEPSIVEPIDSHFPSAPSSPGVAEAVLEFPALDHPAFVDTV